LSGGDSTLVLANAAHVRNVPGRKTDVVYHDLGPDHFDRRAKSTQTQPPRHASAKSRLRRPADPSDGMIGVPSL
jgi:hypothetical protein